MRSAAAVGIDDDLAPGQAAVSLRSADDELAGGIDLNTALALGNLLAELGQDRADDVLDHGLADHLVGNIVVLGRNQHLFHRDRLAVDVADGHLALAVGANPIQGPVLPDVGQALDEAVGDGDRQRHQDVGLGAGVAEHHSLVPRTAGIDSHGDIRRLLVDAGQHGTGVGVVAQ